MPTVDFQRLNWEDYPSQDTPINAENLNRLEEGVAGLYRDYGDIEDHLSIAQGYVVNINSISSLPRTVSNPIISANDVVVNSVLSVPSAQTEDWTVTTANGSLTISGTISGTTNLQLFMAAPSAVI